MGDSIMVEVATKTEVTVNVATEVRIVPIVLRQREHDIGVILAPFDKSIPPLAVSHHARNSPWTVELQSPRFRVTGEQSSCEVRHRNPRCGVWRLASSMTHIFNCKLEM
jgi:hypothetical protein